MTDAAPADMAPASSGMSVRVLAKDVLIVGVLCMLAGIISGWLSPLPKKETASHSDTAPAVATGAEAITDLAPVVTNLAEPSDVWIRLEASIIYSPKKLPAPATEAGKISADIMAYLHTLSLKNIEGPVGLQNLREDLSDRARARSSGSVSEVLVRALVVQ